MMGHSPGMEHPATQKVEHLATGDVTTDFGRDNVKCALPLRSRPWLELY